MDNRPIGVFDSGIGGLTVVKKLSMYLPNEHIIYLGDTGRVPYGSRSRETIIKYANQEAAFLTQFNIKAMVIACNTICGVAYDSLAAAYGIPVFEVITAPAKAAANITKNNKIGIIGTTATIQSGMYETKLKQFSSAVSIYCKACPLFVPMVEYGRTDSNDIAALTIAGDYLSVLCEVGIDTLILGCTHYPLLEAVIAKVTGPDVKLIDSGEHTSKLVFDKLDELDLLSVDTSGGSIRYYVTDRVDDFTSQASRYLQSSVEGLVMQVILD